MRDLPRGGVVVVLPGAGRDIMGPSGGTERAYSSSFIIIVRLGQGVLRHGHVLSDRFFFFYMFVKGGLPVMQTRRNLTTGMEMLLFDDAFAMRCCSCWLGSIYERKRRVDQERRHLTAMPD